MNINTKKQRPKTRVVALALTFIALGGLGTYWYLRWSANNDYNNPVTDNIVTDKEQPIINSPSSGQDKVIVPAPVDGDESNSLAQPEKPNITRFEQLPNGSIRVSAILTKPSTGTCRLRLHHGSNLVEKTAAVIVGPSYYTCNGFLVPRTEIPESGEWTAIITHQLNNNDNDSDSARIIIQ